MKAIYLVTLLLSGLAHSAAWADTRQVVMIHSPNPLHVEVLKSTYGANLKADTYYCSTATLKKAREELGYQCETYSVQGVRLGDFQFDRASYMADLRGNIRELVASTTGKCDVVMQNYFKLSGAVYKGIQQRGGIPAAVIDNTISYNIPVPAGSKLQGNSVTVNMHNERCGLYYRFLRAAE